MNYRQRGRQWVTNMKRHPIGYTIPPEGIPVEQAKGLLVVCKPNGQSPYIVEGYCRENRKYALQDWNDANHYRYLRKGTKVYEWNEIIKDE